MVRAAGALLKLCFCGKSLHVHCLTGHLSRCWKYCSMSGFVQEGKSILFQRFAGVNSIDLEIAEENAQKVRH